MRRVLYIVGSFPTNSTTFTTNEMLALRDLGADVRLAALRQAEAGTQISAADAQLLDRVVYLPLTQPRVWWGALAQLVRRPALIGLVGLLLLAHLISPFTLLKLLLYLPRGLYLGGWVRQHDIEHIHAHFLSAPTTLALIAAAVSGVPYSATVHAFDIFCERGPYRNAAVRLKCERAAAIIAISGYNRRYLHDHYPGLRARIEVIHNGIDLDLFTPGTRPAQRGWHIITCGRLVRKKGHHVLIEAVARLRAAGHPATLSIIGSGPQERGLREQVATLDLTGAVTFLGSLPEDAVAAQYQQADLFALASVPSPDGDMDGIPTVLIEALAVALPSVSTRLSGIPELIEDGVTGRLVAPDDPVALAEALLWLHDHPAEAAQMARAGRGRVIREFDRRKNAVKLWQVWQTLHKQDSQ